MEFTFGKHEGKQVASILFSHPKYIEWMINEGMTGRKEYKFILNLLEKLENQPFNKKCYGSRSGDCTNNATRMSLYRGGAFSNHYWFCDECDIYSTGANKGKLYTISSFFDFYHESPKHGIKVFASAKGLPERKTKKALKEFFGY